VIFVIVIFKVVSRVNPGVVQIHTWAFQKIDLRVNVNKL